MSYGFSTRDENRIRGREEDDREGAFIKTVTIRGVDGRIYDEFSQIIQSSGLTMGEAISKMMRDISKDFDDVFPQLSARNLKYLVNKDKIRVQHYGHLSVSLKDLEEADKSVSFQHIDHLTLEPDITVEAFETYIRSIQHCGTLRVPDVLPKLLLYSKVGHCENIEVYNPNTEEM
jgi:hypothetical protein